MRVAAKAFHFEIAIPGIERIAERGRWLRRTLKAEHALVPRIAGEPVGFLAGSRGPFCPPPGPMRRRWSRSTSCPCERGSPGHDAQASRYRLRWMTCRAQRRLATRG